MAIFVGIDGGGSKTACAVGDESAVLAASVAAGSNLVRVGEKAGREALHAAIRQACAAAGVSASEVRGACIGMAGAARPEVRSVAERMVAELIPGRIEVIGDMEIALEAAFGAEAGVVVIAGTGSIAFGHDGKGRTARAGGWGFAVSDEGSGHWIGRRAVAAALRAEDEGRETPLMKSILESWRITREQLVMAANATPPADFAGLLPEICRLSEAGDPACGEILTAAAGELVELAAVVMDRLFPEEAARVAMSGGVFRHCGRVRENFRRELLAKFPSAALNGAIADPAEGALRRARRLAG